MRLIGFSTCAIPEVSNKAATEVGNRAVTAGEFQQTKQGYPCAEVLPDAEYKELIAQKKSRSPASSCGQRFYNLVTVSAAAVTAAATTAAATTAATAAATAVTATATTTTTGAFFAGSCFVDSQ